MDNIRRTNRGSELLQCLENDNNRTVTIVKCKGHTQWDPHSDNIYLNLNFRPTIETDQGPIKPSIERILGHEFGHAVDDSAVRFRLQIDDVLRFEIEKANIANNENPIAEGLGELRRLRP